MTPGRAPRAVVVGGGTCDRIRRPRARRIAGRSAQLGRVGQLEGRLARAVRDLAVRWVPDALTERQLDDVLRWTPPGSSP